MTARASFLFSERYWDCSARRTISECVVELVRAALQVAMVSPVGIRIDVFPSSFTIPLPIPQKQRVVDRSSGVVISWIQ